MLSSAPTCEDGRADHFALLTPSDGVQADLVLGSGEQAGQGVVGHVAVNHHAVHPTCGGGGGGGWDTSEHAAIALIPQLSIDEERCLASC